MHQESAVSFTEHEILLRKKLLSILWGWRPPGGWGPLTWSPHGSLAPEQEVFIVFLDAYEYLSFNLKF